MSKRDDAEGARLIQEMHLYYMEMTKSNPARIFAKELGYSYLKITATDMDTGEEIGTVYTMRHIRNADEGKAFIKASLRSAAEWPRELLDKLQSIALANGRMLTQGAKSARLIADKQLLGGRPKQDGISPEKAKEYRDIANWYHQANLTQREFCRQAGIERSKLSRALKYVSNNPP